MSSCRRTPLGRRATTLRRILGCMGVLVGAHSASAAPISEAELVRRYLASPVARVSMSAMDDRVRAERRASPLFGNPELDVRHEEARGVAGATTDAVGLSFGVDLGLSNVSAWQAARLSGEAAQLMRSAQLLERVCELRRQGIDLHAATAATEVTVTSQGRLKEMVGTLEALAEAGEASGYDRDRAALALFSHHADVIAVEGKRIALQVGLSAKLGEPVDAVVLAPLAQLPARETVISRVASHPEVLGLRVALDASRKGEAAARRGGLPDVRLAGARRWDAPPGGTATPGFEVGGAVELPLFEHAQSEVRKAAATRADADAVLLRREGERVAAVQGAWQRAASLEDAPTAVDPEGIWTAATARYVAGEASVEGLLQVAEAVESAQTAGIERDRLLRRAHLDVACGTGHFAELEIQSAIEEALR